VAIALVFLLPLLWLLSIPFRIFGACLGALAFINGTAVLAGALLGHRG
jgi:hypothetical protein